MRVVAADTVHRFGCNSCMHGAEISSTRLVTLGAERLLRQFEQWHHAGSVRLVTAHAVLPSRGMGAPVIHFRLQILVARQAEVDITSQQQLRQAGFVWVMTAAALSLLYRLVPA